MDFDFEGWASKNDLKCSDGVTIRKNAFACQDGAKVPLVWSHIHDDPSKILGHAILENRDEGVYAYGILNNGDAAKSAREALVHGDVESLSIWANNLKQIGSDIIHGVIREVSLVLAGANPGAFVESVIAHGESMEEGEDEGLFYTGEPIILSHSDDKKNTDQKKGEKEDDQVKKDKDSTITVGDVIETLNDDQKAAVAVLIGQAIQDTRNESDKDDEEGKKDMKHNIFDSSTEDGDTRFLSHSDMEKIFSDAKRLGSLREAVKENLEEGGVLSHASLDTEGMVTPTGTAKTYGVNGLDMLMPDYRAISATPEWISRNMNWVQKVLTTVHRTPFAKIKSVYANITEDEARARGYITGKQKKEEVFSTLKRTTDPQTIYKKQKMDRDDLIDIGAEFDVVAWIKAEMKMMMDEEKARAILIGDGRPADSDDKIKEDRVRPIATDVALFNTVVKVTVPENATEAQIAKATINAVIRGRKKYKGSGTPSFWTTEDVVTEMLLLEDNNGRKLYTTQEELDTALRVKETNTVAPMEGQTITIGSGSSAKTYPLIGIVVNMVDYNVGADRAGEDNMFEDFDIDYNQQKYLLEGRMSGALVKPFSALTIVLDQETATGASTQSSSRSKVTE